MADRALRTLFGLQRTTPRWAPLVHDLSVGAQESRRIWITQLQVGGQGYQIKGRATEAEAVPAFARRFPGSRITEVTHTSIRGRTIYDFRVEAAVPFAMASDVQGRPEPADSEGS